MIKAMYRLPPQIRSSNFMQQFKHKPYKQESKENTNSSIEFRFSTDLFKNAASRSSCAVLKLTSE